MAQFVNNKRRRRGECRVGDVGQGSSRAEICELCAFYMRAWLYVQYSTLHEAEGILRIRVLLPNSTPRGTARLSPWSLASAERALYP